MTKVNAKVKAPKATTTPLSLEEMLAQKEKEREEQIERLHMLQIVEVELNHYLDSISESLVDNRTSYESVGKETEQATNYNGELLYSIPNSWRALTIEAMDEWIAEGKLTEEQKEGRTPYYRDKYEYVDLTEERFNQDSYRVRKEKALLILRDLLKDDVAELVNML